MENTQEINLIELVKYCCPPVGGAILGKLIWNGFKVGFLDPSVKTVALQSIKFYGWPVVAFAVGSLFGSYLPILTHRPPNKELGQLVGGALALTVFGAQTYLWGSAILLPLLGCTLIGGGLIELIKKIGEYVEQRFYHPKNGMDNINNNLNNNILSPSNRPDYLKEPANCSVCLEPISQELPINKMPEKKVVQKFTSINKEDMTPLQTECNHFFHAGCFGTWVGQMKVKTFCPVCRHDFNFISKPSVREVVGDLFKTIIEKIEIRCLLIVYASVGKIIWNGFKVSILDSSVREMAFRAAKFWGWPLIASVVGSLFVSFLSCLRGRRHNPEFEFWIGRRLELITSGVQIYLLGSHNTLTLLGNSITGGIGLLLVALVYMVGKAIFKYAVVSCFCPPPRHVNFDFVN